MHGKALDNHIEFHSIQRIYELSHKYLTAVVQKRIEEWISLAPVGFWLSETFSEMLERERDSDWRHLTLLQKSLVRGSCTFIENLVDDATFRGILAEDPGFHTALLKFCVNNPDIARPGYRGNVNVCWGGQGLRW